MWGVGFSVSPFATISLTFLLLHILPSVVFVLVRTVPLSCSHWHSITKRITAQQPYVAFFLKIKLVCSVKELSSAESGNMGSYSAELLEVSESQQKTGATGTRCWKAETHWEQLAGKEGESKRWNQKGGETCKCRGMEDKMGNGATRVSVSVTLFHMVDALFKRPITL